MRKPKLTYKMVEQAVEMKGHGLSNVDICAGLGITEGTFYRWLREGDTKLKRALKQGLKKAEVETDEVPKITLGVEVRVAGGDGDGDD